MGKQGRNTIFCCQKLFVLADIYKDEDGHVIEGEPDETLYDTLYKYLVLFGIVLMISLPISIPRS